jgi:phosphate transport system protein
MREVFHAELEEFGRQLAELAEAADHAMSRATEALEHNDRALAVSVIGEENMIEALHHALDDHAVELLARQQPVATDLRTIVAGLRMSADLQRMATLGRHVAEFAVLRHPEPAVPAHLLPVIKRMGEVARRLVGKTRAVLQSRDAEAALALERDDDEMDQLQQALYAQLLSDEPRPDTQVAMDIGLIGRFYERFADHAVSVAKRVAFIAGRSIHLAQT